MSGKKVISTLSKIGLLGLIVLLSNWIYTKYFWKNDLKKYDAHVLLDLLEKQDTSDVLYFGESSNFSYHPEDTQRLSISTLIGHSAKMRVGSINKGAYHAGIFIPLIRRISSPTVQFVIVTLNMRTLNQATIHAPIETSLQKQARLFIDQPPLWNRVMLTLNAYDDQTEIERDKAMWYEWTYDTLKSEEVEFPAPTIKTWCAMAKFVDENGVEDMDKRTLADHYIKAYAFQLDIEQNPRIAQLDEIIQICNEKGIKLVFNLLAENVEYADSLVGEPLVYVMRENAIKLVGYFTAQGVTVVDNLELVPGSRYTDQNWTTEHYDQVGRQMIADNVARMLLSVKEESNVPVE